MIELTCNDEAGLNQMTKIEKYLSEWAGKGLISSSQKDDIIRYEQERQGHDRTHWILYGFISLGIAVIGIGIISLVAANWDKIPPMVKLINNFLFLCAVAVAVYRVSGGKKEFFYEGFLSLFALLCLASIGLISQVFHTGGELYQALLLWLVIVFPLTLMARRDFLLYLWSAAAVVTYFFYAFSDHSYWYNLTKNHYFSILYTIFIMLPFVLLFLWQLFSWFAPLRRHGRIMALWMLPFFLLAVIIVDEFFAFSNINPHVPGVSYPVLVTAVPAMGLTFFSRKISLKEKALISGIGLLFLLILVPQELNTHIFFGGAGKFYGALFSLIMLLLGALYAIAGDRRRLFHLFTLLMGIRFLIVYFQVFEDLATTGFGLIVSGVIIIGVSLLWFKTRDRLEAWLRRVF